MDNAKKYVSVICEYNPFHFGHLYQLEKLKESFDGVICIMSGDIVQRGSIAVAGKYVRAEAALNSGADLVLELPVPWCCSSARDFARGGVHIAHSIGCGHLAFGAEDDFEIINQIYSLMQEDDFSLRVADVVEKSGNLSYPAAVSEIVGEILGEDAKTILAKPNNILALEYLSAMKDTHIKPFAVKRNLELQSSSRIRNLGSGENMLSALPEASRQVFEKVLGQDFPRNIGNMDSYFIGSLRRMNMESHAMRNIYSVPDDLAQRIISSSMKYSSTEEIVSACSNKIYTSARVRRGINALVFGISSERVRSMPPYTCVLAANNVGREILKSAKKTAGIHIITKPAKAISADSETKEAFLFAKGIEDIISLAAPCPEPADKGKTPIIKTIFPSST